MVKQSHQSGIDGERESDPRQPAIWNQLFPLKDDPEYPLGNNGEFMNSEEYIRWLARKGVFLHNLIHYSNQKYRCTIAGCSHNYWEGSKQTFALQWSGHLRTKHKRKITSEEYGLHIDGNNIVDCIYEPDHVYLDHENKTAIIFENKKIKDAGSVEEKVATSCYKAEYYQTVFSSLGYSLLWHVFTVTGERMATVAGKENFCSQVKWCCEQQYPVRFLNFEDGYFQSSPELAD